LAREPRILIEARPISRPGFFFGRENVAQPGASEATPGTAATKPSASPF